MLTQPPQVPKWIHGCRLDRSLSRPVRRGSLLWNAISLGLNVALEQSPQFDREWSTAFRCHPGEAFCECRAESGQRSGNLVSSAIAPEESLYEFSAAVRRMPSDSASRRNSFVKQPPSSFLQQILSKYKLACIKSNGFSHVLANSHGFSFNRVLRQHRQQRRAVVEHKGSAGMVPDFCCLSSASAVV